MEQDPKLGLINEIYDLLKQNGNGLYYKVIVDRIRENCKKRFHASTLIKLMSQDKRFCTDEVGNWTLTEWVLNNYAFRFHPSDLDIRKGTISIEGGYEFFFLANTEKTLVFKNDTGEVFPITLDTNERPYCLRHLSDWFKEVSFIPGDNIIFTVLDPLENIFEIRKETFAEKESSKTKQRNSKIIETVLELFRYKAIEEINLVHLTQIIATRSFLKGKRNLHDPIKQILQQESRLLINNHRDSVRLRHYRTPLEEEIDLLLVEYTGGKYRVEDLKEKIVNAKKPSEAFKNILEETVFTNDEEAEEFGDLLVKLWNNTARHELDGLTPLEMSQDKARGPKEAKIIQEFISHIERELDTKTLEEVKNDPEAYLYSFQNQWLTQHNQELDGRTPLEIIMEERQQAQRRIKNFKHSQSSKRYISVKDLYSIKGRLSKQQVNELLENFISSYPTIGDVEELLEFLRVKGEETTFVLLEKFFSENPTMRNLAIFFLTKLNDPLITQIMQKIVYDETQEIQYRIAAYTVLEQLGESIPENDLYQLFGDTEELANFSFKEMLELFKDEQGIIGFLDQFRELPLTQQISLIRELGLQKQESVLNFFATQINRDEKKILIAIADALAEGEFNSPKAVNIIQRLLAHPSQPVQKAARKTVFKLRTLGIDIDLSKQQRTRKSSKVLLTNEKLPLFKALRNSTEDKGMKMFVIAVSRPDGKLRFAAFLINSQYGLKDCWGASEFGKREFKETFPLASKEMADVVFEEIDYSVCKEQILAAYQKAKKKGQTIPSAFFVYQDLL